MPIKTRNKNLWKQNNIMEILGGSSIKVYLNFVVDQISSWGHLQHITYLLSINYILDKVSLCDAA